MLTPTKGTAQTRKIKLTWAVMFLAGAIIQLFFLQKNHFNNATAYQRYIGGPLRS